MPLGIHFSVIFSHEEHPTCCARVNNGSELLTAEDARSLLEVSVDAIGSLDICCASEEALNDT